MNTQNVEDVRDTALKLDKIKVYYPEEYFYIKGWIHCLLQKGDREDRCIRNPQRADDLCHRSIT